MKSEMGVFKITIFFISVVMVFFCYLRDADAGFGGVAIEGQRGGGAVEGSRGGEAVEGPRGGEAVEDPSGNVAAEGPRGNVAVGTRYNSLPDSANAVIVGDQTYYVDDSGVYYLPCDDDDTVYCVVDVPQ
jgi:hypothetical protein